MSFTSSRSFSNSRKIKLILTFDLVLLFGCFSGSWLLSGRLAKMLSTDCEQNDCQLTLSGMFFYVIGVLIAVIPRESITSVADSKHILLPFSNPLCFWESFSLAISRDELFSSTVPLDSLCCFL